MKDLVKQLLTYHHQANRLSIDTLITAHPQSAGRILHDREYHSLVPGMEVEPLSFL